MTDTWNDVHAGDIVRGHDGQLYGVASIERGDPCGMRVTLRRNGVPTTAQPLPTDPITIHAATDITLEAVAWQTLHDAGLGPEIIGETHG